MAKKKFKRKPKKAIKIKRKSPVKAIKIKTKKQRDIEILNALIEKEFAATKIKKKPIAVRKAKTSKVTKVVYKPVKKKKKVLKLKVKSKTQKTLENKIKYQQLKLNEIRKELSDLTFNLRERKNLAGEFQDENTKLIALRDIDTFIKKGDQRKFKTIYAGVLNEGTKISTEIFQLQKKLQRFKDDQKRPVDKWLGKLPEGEGYFRMGLKSRSSVYAKAWDAVDIENATLNNPELTHVNGISKAKDKDKILDYLNDLKLKMASEQTLLLVYGNDGNGLLFIIEASDIEKLEGNKNKKKK
jgi:hypothetical protein